MGASSKARIIFAVIVVAVLLSGGFVWILSDKEGISWSVSLPIAFVVLGVVLALLQWLVPTSPPQPRVAASQLSAFVSSPQPNTPARIPQTFREEIRRRLAPGTGAVVVLVEANQVGQEFHLLEKKIFTTPEPSRQLVPTGKGPDQYLVQSAIVNAYRREDYQIYAAVFRDLASGNYGVWMGRLANVDFSDPIRRRGAWVYAGNIVEVHFAT